MSKATMTVEGFASEPKARVSQSGKQMLDVAVAHTPRRFNKQANQWEDVTDKDGQKVTTWARATFFDEKAAAVAAVVQRGTLVRLEGEPRLNPYTDGQGKAAASIDLQFADISLVVQAARQDAPQPGFGSGTPAQAPTGQGQADWGAPAASQGFGDGFGGQPF